MVTADLQEEFYESALAWGKSIEKGRTFFRFRYHEVFKDVG